MGKGSSLLSILCCLFGSLEICGFERWYPGICDGTCSVWGHIGSHRCPRKSATRHVIDEKPEKGTVCWTRGTS